MAESGFVTMEQVSAAVREIAASAQGEDDEVAHAREDELYASVLRDIARGHPDPLAIATAALQAADIPFNRWCA